MTTEELAKGVPDLRRWIDFALFELPGTQAVAADSRAVPDRHGGSGKVKVTADGGHDGHADALGDKAYRASRAAPVTGRHEGAVGAPGKNYAPPPRSLEEMLRLQGLPADLFEHEGAKSPYTVQAKRKLVGNAVPYPMACALAEAVRKAVCE
jgi:site-specific DNA-cytosine methylase